MSLKSRFQFRFALPKALAMDLGSSYTRIKSENKIIFHDRTCIVFHEETQAVIAIGQAAEVYQGRVPAGMKLVRPIRSGKVSDVTATNLFLKAVLEKIHQPEANIGLNITLPFIS